MALPERVWLLFHYPNEDESRAKTIGLFSAPEIAQDAVMRLLDLPGFSGSTPSDFVTDEYPVDELGWRGGFFRAHAYGEAPRTRRVEIAHRPWSSDLRDESEKVLYLLWHLGPSIESWTYNGVFTSVEAALGARARLSLEEGYSTTPLEFGISVHRLNRVHWASGFRAIALSNRPVSNSVDRALMLHNSFGPGVSFVSNRRLLEPSYEQVPGRGRSRTYRAASLPRPANG
jgi:hypothetical protein